VIVRAPGAEDAEDSETDEPGARQTKVIIRTSGDDAPVERGARKEVAWLGVSTEESSEALASQLGLQPGEGLLVTYVATNSPAASSSLQRNDVLVEIDGQKLVLPGQLRKLVHMRKEGDQVVIGYYRGGKKQEATVTLGKTRASLGLFGDSDGADGLKPRAFQLRDLASMDGLNEHLSEWRKSLARAGVDRENIQAEVRRSLDRARKAVAEAMAQVHQAGRGARSAPQALEELARSGVEVDQDATVTIKSRNDLARTIVKTDDTGTYVIVANPKKRLTAHDKDGKLLFDGEIDTNEQQEKVPKDVWKEVQPMIEQLNHAGEPAPTPAEPAPGKTSALPAGESGRCGWRLRANLRTFAAMAHYLIEPENPPPAIPGTNRLHASTGAASVPG